MPAALAIRSPTLIRSPNRGHSPRLGSRRGYFSNVCDARLQRTISGSAIGTREQVLACLRIQATLRQRLIRRALEQAANDENGDEQCAVCLDDGMLETPWPGGCGHSFCEACTERCLQREPACCPLCRAPAPLQSVSTACSHSSSSSDTRESRRAADDASAFALREAIRTRELRNWAHELIRARNEAGNASSSQVPAARRRTRRGRLATWLVNEINDLADFVLS